MDDIALPVVFDGEEEEVYEILWTEMLTINNQPIADFEDITVGIKVMAPWICDGKTNMAEAKIISLKEGGRLLSKFIMWLLNQQVLSSPDYYQHISCSTEAIEIIGNTHTTLPTTVLLDSRNKNPISNASHSMNLILKLFE